MFIVNIKDLMHAAVLVFLWEVYAGLSLNHTFQMIKTVAHTVNN